jgi:hypothetical protein
MAVDGGPAMSKRDEPMRPMTLGNLQRNGLRGPDVTGLN